jgi:hyperosmotically inducible protein
MMSGMQKRIFPNLLLRLLCLLIMAGLVQGCASMVVGGAANGGHTTSTSGRQATDDASITSAINSRFVRDELVRAVDIHVVTRQGIVTLTGMVDSPAVSQRAVQLARGIHGVRRVDSRLTVRR